MSNPTFNKKYIMSSTHSHTVDVRSTAMLLSMLQFLVDKYVPDNVVVSMNTTTGEFSSVVDTPTNTREEDERQIEMFTD